MSLRSSVDVAVMTALWPAPSIGVDHPDVAALFLSMK